MTVRRQDDLYEAVNADWAAQAVIPDDKARTGGFSDLADDIEKLMLTTTERWQTEGLDTDDQVLANFVKYHRLARDWRTRDQLGSAPVQPMIERYQAMQHLQDFTDQLADLELAGMPNELPLGIAPDFKDAQTNVLWADGLSTILPDTTYYEPNHPQGAALLQKWRQAQEALFKAFGFDEETTRDILDKALAFDQRVADYVLSNEEAAEYVKLYHPYSWADFKALAPQLPWDDFMKKVLGQLPDKIIVSDVRFWSHADQFYSQEAWPLLKAMLLVDVVNAYTGYLSNDLRLLGGAYSRELSGTPAASSQDKSAYYLAAAPFNQALGLWYAHKYFSPAAKADVEHKVQTMIDVYKQRLAAIDWLEASTKIKAQEKLDAIVPHIGYPEKLPARYYEKTVDEGASLFDTANKFIRQSIAYQWSKWNQPVNRSEWHMPAHLVNAYYDPQQNQIVFPAAILQAPFYSLDQTSSENYGGIGAVIAHEISHAFDTNGASFDEHGSLNNWWTEKDYAAFNERTQKIVAEFDGLDSYGAKVNGKLTVSENVADLGGVAAALQAAQAESDYSAQAFFNNWAKIWRMKARPEFMRVMATTDVHAPAKLRANVIATNFDEFMQAFSVKPTDGMYRAPGDRVVIW